MRIRGGSHLVVRGRSRRAYTGALAALSAIAVMLVAAAGASAFSASGSVEQVDVTGLVANAQASLLSSSGATVATQEADSLGGLLFQEVKPGEELPRQAHLERRRVGADHRSQPGLGTLGSEHLRTVDPRRRLLVPDHARRDEARDRRAPTDEHRGQTVADLGAPPAVGPRGLAIEHQRRLPDDHRILGLRLRQPRRPRKRDRGGRQPDGLRGRRREHARDRLLGRSLRLLRTTAEPRRLRRGPDGRQSAVGARPQGRDARDLLRRDQPAFHRSDPPARPRGDRPAVGDRCDGLDALPGRHPQHRLRRRVGRTAPAER